MMLGRHGFHAAMVVAWRESRMERGRHFKRIFASVVLIALFTPPFMMPLTASAKTPSGGIESLEAPWILTRPYDLPDLDVALKFEDGKPVYTVRLPHGERIVIEKQIPMVSDSSLRLSQADLAMVAEDTRVMLESTLRLLWAGKLDGMSVVSGREAQSIEIDPAWLSQNGLRQVAIGTPLRSKLVGAFQFVRDAIYTSAIEAYQYHRQVTREMRSHVKEYGIQIAFRLDVQIGMGNLNITKNLPVVLSFGYNREKRQLVFRSGFRQEKMSKGTAISVGVRMELRRYKLSVDEPDMPRYTSRGSIQGQSWYTPSIPILSPVADSGRGFQSEGLAIGVNLADLVPGSYLLNTVNAFTESQKVYTAELPRASEFLERLRRGFGGGGGRRCQALFQTHGTVAL
ncbi:MAG: hypothetical protein RBT63_01610 [Bdellovibrionales bacterium]|jgi:hypothetical protein|nr:hypothetical protein [Bdellovibrionales bacterium]